ncbi:MAG: hypothetical protein QOF90_2 [Acetobacteraceae bacterium]|nr:hypothetical protein [Acetobacteraceae bacterium]
MPPPTHLVTTTYFAPRPSDNREALPAVRPIGGRAVETITALRIGGFPSGRSRHYARGTGQFEERAACQSRPPGISDQPTAWLNAGERYPNAASRDLASCKSLVSKPSVNQP